MMKNDDTIFLGHPVSEPASYVNKRKQWELDAGTCFSHPLGCWGTNGSASHKVNWLLLFQDSRKCPIKCISSMPVDTKNALVG